MNMRKRTVRREVDGLVSMKSLKFAILANKLLLLLLLLLLLMLPLLLLLLCTRPD